MGKLQFVLLILVVFASTTLLDAKTLGKFKKYNQVTDKEILIESNTGSKILVSAFNDYAIGIKIVSPDEEISLISPSKIHLANQLSGSIYVEELDEMMQITTTIADGLVIKIEKNPLRFTYINKQSKEILLEEQCGLNFNKKENTLKLHIDENENLKIVSSNDLITSTTPIKNGQIINSKNIKEYCNPVNEICILSSRGYALVVENNKTQNIDFSKEESLKISNQNGTNFSYILIYGPEKPELIDKYAFNISKQDKQISLK